MSTRHVHFLGICGYAVSGAALLAQQLGYRVTGSDDFAYPPTTDVLTAAGIEWVDGSDPANLDRWGEPDLVVVGNQTRTANPEWAAVRERGLAYTSEIEFFVGLTEDRVRVAVCGTHGKTTTSALVAHMLERSGLDPGLRLGSQSLDLGTSARLGSGAFVYEGDEYTTAPWDRRPKFLHVRPALACVTRLELDHPDIYPDLDAYRAPFLELARTMPADGLLLLCNDDDEAAALRDIASCRAETYGERSGSDWHIGELRETPEAQHFTVRHAGEEFAIQLSFPGRHNAANATAALGLALAAGGTPDACIDACRDFRGPARRFQILGTRDGITVVDDYAHHPTECRAALEAARRRYEGRRIVAVHTPHTYSRTLALLEDYADVFVPADVLILGPIEAARERGAPETVTSADVARTVSHPADVHVVASSDEALDLLASIAQPGDVDVVLSLGGFDKIAQRRLAALGESGG